MGDNIQNKISHCNSYINDDINRIKMLYKAISEGYLAINKIKEKDQPSLKKETKKHKKRIDELFDRTKVNREVFLQDIRYLIDHRKDENVIYNSSNFLKSVWELESIRAKSDKLYKTIFAVINARDSDPEDDFYFKRVKLETMEREAIRLDSLIDSDLRYLKKVTNTYDEKEDRHDDIQDKIKKIYDRR